MKKSILVALTLATPLFAATFNPPCKLPFAAISTKQPIDSKCGLSGSPKNTTALAAQDTAKDNFCATGTPVVLTFDVYPGLQAAAEKVLGGPKYEPPASRAALHDLYTIDGKKIGEGTLASIAGYVESAHYSDVDDGESVNCDLTGEQNNDIHIPLVATAGADECTSVTAEISPHFRPNVWTASNINQPGVPLRFTGQLLFDAEHKPCRGTTVEEPKRQSVWEIHPVYAVDVCVLSNASACNANDDKAWMALDAWLKQHSGKK
jgi:hypothetical protein